MKKGKLILSLAMMCLSVAVLCFGVLAATSVNYTISGSISYDVKDVFVKINTNIFGVADKQDKATVIANVKTLESKSLNSIADSTYKLSQTITEYNSTTATTDPATGSSEDIDLTYGGTNGYYTYYIVINIQNLSSSKPVYAKVTDNTTAELNSIKTTNLYQNAITSNDTKNIVIAYSIKDKSSSINSAEINYTLTVEYRTEENAYKNPIELTTATTSNGAGYFVTLGKTDSTVTTDDVKWRLVSLDGVNKYTYTDGSDELEARYLSDAVFVQETVVGSAIAFDSANTQNYYNSTIRANIQGGTYFNLGSADISFIRDRKIESINYWKKQDYDSTTESYNGYALSTTQLSNTDNSIDKFWLLSCEEVTTYFDNADASRVWWGSDTKSMAFWLRSPLSDDSTYVCFVGVGGKLSVVSARTSSYWNVRAAFQLA